jgi:predicted hotdog family 3-hydroxylacyl-ACP dehydratase
MVMIGALVSSTLETTTTSFLVDADNILVNQGCFTEAGLVENIAQTAAFHAGYNRDLSKPVQLGFIGALKDLKIYILPKVADWLTTTITITHQVMGATVIEGKVVCNGQLMAEVEMKIFIQAEN